MYSFFGVFNEFHEDLRQLIFYLSLHINSGFQEKFKDKNSDEPTIDDLSMATSEHRKKW